MADEQNNPLPSMVPTAFAFGALGTRIDPPVTPHASDVPAPEGTLTLPKVRIGDTTPDAATALPTYEALRERLQQAALMARQNRATEALSEFEAIYTSYLSLGDPALAAIGVKAAYNRGVLLEKLLGDAARAEVAFEKLFANFATFEAAEIRTVVARSGLHAARLSGVLNHLATAVQRYADRLGPFGEYLPPLELRGFIADYRRLRAEFKEQEQAEPPRLVSVIAPGEDAARFVADPARTMPPQKPLIAAEPPAAAPPIANEREASPSATTPGPIAAMAAAARADMTRAELFSHLDAMDRRMSAYVADARGEVNEVRTALNAVTTQLGNLQAQHLQLRNELQAHQAQLISDLQGRFHELRDDQRSAMLDARTDLRALAAEQRSGRIVLTAVVVLAAAAVVALSKFF